jgi:hypothetical protein
MKVSGQKLWMEAEKEKVRIAERLDFLTPTGSIWRVESGSLHFGAVAQVTGRTWQSMREHYIKTLRKEYEVHQSASIKRAELESDPIDRSAAAFLH